MTTDPKSASAHGLPGATVLMGADLTTDFVAMFSSTPNAFVLKLTHALFGGQILVAFPLQVAENLRQFLNNNAAARQQHDAATGTPQAAQTSQAKPAMN